MISRKLRELGLPGWLADAAESKVLAHLEPAPRRQRSGVPKKIAGLVRIITRARDDAYVTLPRPVGRDSLIEACKHVMGTLDHEMIVVGLGRRRGLGRGSPSHITGLWIARGLRCTVQLTDRARALVRERISCDSRGEVILVHNHPVEPMRLVVAGILGFDPIPSLTDRATASHRHAESVREFMLHFDAGFYRFYLVDCGEVSEFFLPPVETGIAALEQWINAPPLEQLGWVLGLVRQAPWR